MKRIMGNSWLGITFGPSGGHTNQYPPNEPQFWDDGEQITFTNWRDGNPQADQNKLCAQIKGDGLDDGLWKNCPCGEDNQGLKKYPICMRPAVTVSTTKDPSTIPTASPHEECDYGWHFIPSSQKCVLLMRDEKPWKTALGVCEGEGGTLASINSPDEQEEVFQIASLDPAASETFSTGNTKNEATRVLLDVFYTTTFLIGIIGNLFVLLLNSLGNDRIAANPSTKGIISLAVANLFHLFSIPFLLIPKQKQLPIGVIGCKILRSNDYISFLASTLILALLSLDRFGLICFAQNSTINRVLRISWRKCLACFLLATLFALPMIIFSQYDSVTKDCVVRFPDLNSNSKSDSNMYKRYYISIFLGGFVSPFTVIMFCYSRIIYFIRRQEAYMQNISKNGKGKTIRVMYLVGVTVVTFVICWTPLHIYNLMKLTENKFMSERSCVLLGRLTYVKDNNEDIFNKKTLKLSLIFLNDALNPIIYSFISSQSRSRAKLIIQKSALNQKKFFGLKNFFRKGSGKSPNTSLLKYSKTHEDERCLAITSPQM
ncbi:Oidioi.mRNA.OKI2018_I69.chr1.g763.t2.cds [Oikopleura dioica]|uniref:Oidioi.mRNA.OKI2018_I69.chr1.g763.t2.cds n=1 Tax=Oikopleura dioica TaxID=34765 RepID=A0ABN7ST09_OIKDI|nr:Oidioi.mRNA.OKI2018_I69.chr1.g763.t2.cds [Oikopleura dioica]